MILYHGSIVPFEEPRILAGFRLLGFGQGFYTTRSYEQAERWAKTKMKREDKDVGYVSVYEFDDIAAKTKLWQYSTPMLYQMYRKSIETGETQYPDI